MDMANYFKYLIILIVGFLLGTFAYKIIYKFCNPKDNNYTKMKIFINLLNTIILVLLYKKYGITAEFLFFSFIMFILLIMLFIDLEMKIIPNQLVIAGLIGSGLVFVYNIFSPLNIYPTKKWWEPLVGILPGSGVLFLIAFLGVAIFKSDEAMGMGDVKIFAPIGAFLGWKMCILSLVLSMFFGGVSSIFLILLKIKKRKDTIPFGPFITIAVLITILFGNDIWNWYFSWL